MKQEDRALPAEPDRATRQSPSPSVSALRASIASAALLLTACDEGYPPPPPAPPAYSPAPAKTASVPAPPPTEQASQPVASASPEYSGVNHVAVNGEVYRICDGDSGRMIFVYGYDGYRQSRGGIVVLTGQGECQ